MTIRERAVSILLSLFVWSMLIFLAVMTAFAGPYDGLVRSTMTGTAVQSISGTYAIAESSKTPTTYTTTIDGTLGYNSTKQITASSATFSGDVTAPNFIGDLIGNAASVSASGVDLSTVTARFNMVDAALSTAAYLPNSQTFTGRNVFSAQAAFGNTPNWGASVNHVYISTSMSAGYALRVSQEGTGSGIYSIGSGTYGLYVADNDAYPLFTVRAADKRVGVGTNAPSVAFNVVGAGLFTSSVTASEFYGSGANLTGLATDGELAAVAASTGTLTEDLATEVSDRGIADAAIAASTAPLKDYANWNTAYGWGDHAGLYLVAPASFTYQTPLVAGTDYLAPDGDGSGLSGVIQSTATGTYALRVATATYLATAPGACSAGEFINALTADGTKTCATPAGGGDVVLASTQTFTGANTFTSSVTFQTSVNLNQTVISSFTTGNHPFGGSTLATWYSNPSWSMAITAGTWNLSLQTSVRIDKLANSAGHMDGEVCLSTSTTAGTGLIDCVMTMWTVPNQLYAIVPINLSVQYVATEPKTIYLHAITRNFSGVTVSADLIEFLHNNHERKRTGRLEATKVRD